MKIDRERDFGGIVVRAEDQAESELLCYLWSNKATIVAFERKDGLVSITFAPPLNVVNG